MMKLFFCMFAAAILCSQVQAAGNRRVRHLNPASAGAVIALDSRFVSSLASGDPVDTWASRRPATVDATGTGSARPLWTAGLQGGQPGIVFDGSNDVLATGELINTHPRTFLVVVERDSDASNNRSVLGNRTSSGGRIMRTTATSLVYARISNVNNTYTYSTPGYPTVWTATDETAANGIIQRANGKQNTTSTTPTNYFPTTVGMQVGAGGTFVTEYFDGKIYAVMVWAGLLSQPQIGRIEQSMAFSFRIPIQ